MILIFATNNLHKIKEIREMTGSKIDLLSLNEVNISDDIPENEPTLEGNALYKARYIFQKTGMDVFADDTGLEVYSLNGEPGVYSARYAGESKDSSANITRLLNELKEKTDRRARFRTVIALIFNGKEHLFEGIVEGTIIPDKKGTDGFGYDPVFLPDGYHQTFAEMNLNDKNLISHRANAFSKLLAFLSDADKKQ
jgi:XTP/dITP diphosphohydrolase